MRWRETAYLATQSVVVYRVSSYAISYLDSLVTQAWDDATAGILFAKDLEHMAKDKKQGRKVGIEVEFNEETDTRAVDTWCSLWGGTVHEDGSCGYEAVTPPLVPSKMKACLDSLQKALEGTGCDNRCGLHVHVDARDITWPDMYRILKVYAKVEGALFVLGGQDRYNNNYTYSCAPEYQKALEVTKDRRYRVLHVALSDNPAYLSQDSFKHLQKQFLRVSDIGKKHHGRYKAINIIPWIAGRFKGRADTTVEFRLHRGTHNADRIWNWANLCSNIVSWAANASSKEIENLPKSPMRALLVISPESKPYILQRLKTWRARTSAIQNEYKRKKTRNTAGEYNQFASLRKMSPLALYSGRSDAIKKAREALTHTTPPTPQRITYVSTATTPPRHCQCEFCQADRRRQPQGRAADLASIAF